VPSYFNWNYTMPALGPNGELVSPPSVIEADPSKGTDVHFADGSWRHFDPVQDANGNYLSPKIFISDKFPGGSAAAMPGTEEYDHYESVMTRSGHQAIIKIAAMIGGAAAAGAFFGGTAPAAEGVETATHVATATDTAYGIAQTAEALQPIIVTAQPIIAGADLLSTGLITGAGAAGAAGAAASVADVMVVTAPAVAGGAAVTAGAAAAGATLLSFPALAGSESAVNALTDDLVNSINTPEMQEAITAGNVPPPPTSVLSSSFTKWGVSTGISALEKQLGRALTPSEEAKVSAQMAAEIQRLQAQLAAQGAPNASLPNPALDQATVASMLDSVSTNKNVQLALLAGAAILLLTSFS
jgi:hypothetical protein